MVYDVNARELDGTRRSRLWCAEPDAASNAIGYAELYSRSHDAVIRIFNGRARVILPPRDPSAAGLCLRDVTLNLVDVGADNGADEMAAAIVNVDLWNRVDVVLLHHRGVPIDDVHLA